MNATEALQLTRTVAELAPGTKITTGTPAAWAIVLRDVSLADALVALRTVYLERGQDVELGARKLEADDIYREVRRMRRDRITAAPPYVPSSPDLSAAEQIDEQRRYLRAVADGQPAPQLGAAPGRRALPLRDRPRGMGPRQIGS